MNEGVRDESEMSRRELIEITVQDLVQSLLWEDRKEDEELERGDIEDAIAKGEISVEEIIKIFADRLREELE